jgi:hypothetical protein
MCTIAISDTARFTGYHCTEADMHTAANKASLTVCKCVCVYACVDHTSVADMHAGCDCVPQHAFVCWYAAAYLPHQYQLALLLQNGIVITPSRQSEESQ